MTNLSMRPAQREEIMIKVRRKTLALTHSYPPASVKSIYTATARGSNSPLVTPVNKTKRMTMSNEASLSASSSSTPSPSPPPQSAQKEKGKKSKQHKAVADEDEDTFREFLKVHKEYTKRREE